MLKWKIIIFILLAACSVYPQAENIPADNPVYEFLRAMRIRGILQKFDDIVLPLPASTVTTALMEVNLKKSSLTAVEIEVLENFIKRLNIQSDSKGIFDNFPGEFGTYFTSISPRSMYEYQDSSVTFRLLPSLGLRYLYSESIGDKALLFYGGGSFTGSYQNWLGFQMSGKSGTHYYNRDAALNDPLLVQSFTFTKTKLDYYDYTDGYIKLEKGIAAVEIGRERILWGNGYIDRNILSMNPPVFDFFKLDFAYKSFKYNFLHGWLVHSPINVFVDSLTGVIREKPSKYIAVSRLGFYPSGRFSAGASQMIIYGNRPVEAAYLTPFLYWESAQRSMNDLDNSFLSFDARYLPFNGAELSGSIIFDDINFELWRKGDFTHYHNRYLWQVGSMLTYPFFIKNGAFKAEYTQVRPYMFSHYGLYDNSLTYTSNGYMLGPDLQPNSTKLSLSLSYRLTSRLGLLLSYSHSLHGNNYYDLQGKLIRNFGGDVFRTLSVYDNDHLSILDGEKERTDFFSAQLQYEILMGIYFRFEYQHKYFKTSAQKIKDNLIWSEISIQWE